MASNITAFTAIPDGSPATPSLFNSRLSQTHLNVVSANSLALDIQSGNESLATNSVGSVQIAKRSVTGGKLATSGITTRALGSASVTSLKIANSGVQGSNLSVGGSEVTARRFIAKQSIFGIAGENTGVTGTLGDTGVVWETNYVLGPASTTSTGFHVSGTDTASGAYISQTSLPTVKCFSDNTTYAEFHSAGFVISNPSPPSGGKGSGQKGDVRWASGFLYVCSSTSSWERVALTRF
jgi:hypothetical protein